MLNKRQVKQLVAKKEVKPPPQPHHSGKGTKARINTAAEKIFNSQVSD